MFAKLKPYLPKALVVIGLLVGAYFAIERSRISRTKSVDAANRANDFRIQKELVKAAKEIQRSGELRKIAAREKRLAEERIDEIKNHSEALADVLDRYNRGVHERRTDPGESVD